MGYVVQADPDALAAGARRLAGAAQTLDIVGGRVLALLGAAGAAAGAGELSTALEETGRAAAQAIGEGASATGELGSRTALAGEEYRLLEHALTGRLATTGQAPRDVATATRVVDAPS